VRIVDQVLQIAGAICILAAYMAAQFRYLNPQSALYLVLNIVGSALLAVLAAIDRQWGFLLLETVWAIVSLWGLATLGRSRQPAGVD
jgi:hypothetical protein